MTQYNSLNVKLFNSQLNELKLGIKNGTEITFNLSSNEITGSNNMINFPDKLLLTDRPVSKFHKAFTNNSLTNIKLSKTRLSMMVQLVGFLGKPLGQLLKPVLPLMKNVLKTLAKNILVSLRLTTAASAADTGIHKKILGSGMKRLIISNRKIEDT